ncbi:MULTISPECIES: hypothetical protein [unclassified Microcoleus]|uniref:hypothetical protein n=1 Tax=unclassified Microcoleus TaxID=2642155 RepID=UPI002FD09F02
MGFLSIGLTQQHISVSTSFAVGDRNPSCILTLTPVPNLVVQLNYEHSASRAIARKFRILLLKSPDSKLYSL